MNASPFLKHMTTPFILNLHRFLVHDHPQHHADVCALAAILGVPLDEVYREGPPPTTLPPPPTPELPPQTIPLTIAPEVEVVGVSGGSPIDTTSPPHSPQEKKPSASAVMVYAHHEAAKAAAVAPVAENVPSFGTTAKVYAGPTRQHAEAQRVQQEFESGQRGGCMLSDVLKMQWTYNGTSAAKNYKQVLGRLQAICKYVTGQASCTSLRWLDDEDAILRFFRDVLPTTASPTGKANNYESLSKWADALRRLYVFYHADFGAKQAQLMRFQGLHDNFCELQDTVRGKATEHEMANTPTVAQIDQLISTETGQNRVFLLHAKQFIGRNMNYICDVLQRATDAEGTELWRWDEAGNVHELTQLDDDFGMHEDGYPMEGNALIRTTAADGTHSFEYFQSAYKTSKTFGRKVGGCSQELGEAITAMGFEGRQSLFQRANGDPVSDDSHVRELCKAIFAPLGMTDVTPTLLRRAMCNSPEHRAAFSLLIDTAAVMNHSLGMHCGGRYTGKGIVT